MSAIWRGRAAGPFFALAFAALAVASLSWTRDHAVPVALGVLVWFLVNALADALERIPRLGPVLPRLVARTLSVAFLFVAILIAGRIVAANISELSADIAETRENVVLAEIRALFARFGLAGLLERDAILERFDVEALAGTALNAARHLVGDASLVFLYALFLMVDERFYEAKLQALQPDPTRREELRRALRNIADNTRLYLWLMTLISLGVAICTWAVCAAFGVPGAGFWGFLAFGLNFIPTLGSFAAVLIPAGYAALTMQDPAALIGLVAVLGAVQFLAGEVVVPRLMGDGLNLSSTVILLALVAWGGVWGPAGMFLAIPLTVILVMVLARFPATRPLAVILSRDGRAGDEAPPRPDEALGAAQAAQDPKAETADPLDGGALAKLQGAQGPVPAPDAPKGAPETPEEGALSVDHGPLAQQRQQQQEG
ncbi:AI-2E family transporter [Rhodovulum sp. DZ06]|uniref:AI-2E family transporter n=1 Tax=Rhodovulum sp. DZ06 TaxID=3425126 RepID=UPI003D33D150